MEVCRESIDFCEINSSKSEKTVIKKVSEQNMCAWVSTIFNSNEFFFSNVSNSWELFFEKNKIIAVSLPIQHHFTDCHFIKFLFDCACSFYVKRRCKPYPAIFSLIFLVTAVWSSIFGFLILKWKNETYNRSRMFFLQRNAFTGWIF